MIIPVQQDKISTDVPGADLNTNAAGVLAHAQDYAATAGADAAFHIYDHMTRAEAEEAANKKMSEFAVQSDLKKQQLKMQSVGGYMIDENGQKTSTSMTEAYRNWANDFYHSGQTSMPNQLGQDMFRDQGAQFFAKEVGHVSAEEYAKRADYMIEQRKARVQDEGNFLQNYPSLDSLFPRLDQFQLDLHNSVKNGSLAADQLDPEKRTVMNALTSQWVTGEINKITLGEVPDYVKSSFVVNGKPVQAPKGQIGAIDDMLAILRDEKQNPVVAGTNPNLYDMNEQIDRRNSQGMITPTKALTPQAKDQFINQLIALRASLLKKTKTDFEVHARNLTAAVENGLPWDDNALQSLIAKGQIEVKNEPTRASEVTEKIMEPVVARAIHDLLPHYANDPSNFKAEPTADQKRVLDARSKQLGAAAAQYARQVGVPENELGFVAQKSIQDFHQKLHQEMIKSESKYKEDPATFLAESRPDLNKALKFIDGGKISALPPEKAAQLRDALDKMDAARVDFSNKGQISKPTVFPNYNNLEDKLALSINDKSVGEAAGIQNINGLRKNLGAHFIPTMDQLIDKKKIDPEFSLVASLNSEVNQRAAYRLILSKDKINDAFKTAFPDQVTAQTLNANIASETFEKLSYQYKNDPQPVRLQKISNINQAISLRAKELMYSDPTMNTTEAAKAAAHQFLGDQAKAKVGSNFLGLGGTRVVYPKILNDGAPVTEENHSQFDAYISRQKSLDEVKKQDWVIPGFMGGVTPEKFKEHIAQYGEPMFGEDPNGSKHPNGRPMQGWYMIIPGFSEKNKAVDVKAEVKGPDGKPKYWFVPARQALADQQSFEAAQKSKSTDFQKQYNKFHGGTWGKGLD